MREHETSQARDQTDEAIITKRTAIAVIRNEILSVSLSSLFYQPIRSTIPELQSR